MEKQESFWDFIPLSKYTPPEVGVQLAVKKGITSLFEKFRKEEKEPSIPGTELNLLEEDKIGRIMDDPDWEGAASRFTSIVDNRFKQDKSKKSVLFVVAPPFSGNREILETWVRKNGLKTVTPPSPEEVLEEREDWMDQISSEGVPWVLSSLEHCFLRHAHGISMIRRFLEKACSGDFGQGIIACDGWGWAFLNYVWRIKHLPVITLKSFDADMLTELFMELYRTGIKFCKSDDGSLLLSHESPAREDEKQRNSYFRYLASYSGGNSGVALAYWNASLRTQPEDPATTENEDSTVWVTPLKEVTKGELPKTIGDDEGFVLHSLLLHNGVSSELLDELLPVSRSRIAEICFLFDQMGIIEETQQGWKVSIYAYPRVKQFLKENDYLTDPF